MKMPSPQRVAPETRNVFRPQRGGLSAAMRELYAFTDTEDLRQHLARKGITLERSESYSGADDRIGWAQTFITIGRYATSHEQSEHDTVIGFTNVLIPQKG